MQVFNNISSLGYNTFQIDVEFKTLIQIESADELNNLDPIRDDNFRILGGGSNILLTEDISEPVVLIRNKGIEVLFEHDDSVVVSVAAGENWHDVVQWACGNCFGGIENLSLIPGNAGTAPIQNIGAYGVEIKDTLHSLKAFHIRHGREFIFHNRECKFGYRDSIFKNEWKHKFIITEIILRLTKKGFHQLNTSYGAINSELNQRGIVNPGIKDISSVVTQIRESKLPNPNIIGNAGSFFKNPVVTKSDYQKLKAEHSDLPHYPVSEEFVKLPAAWLIESCGWKGKKVGETGTYQNQALVLVNHGKAMGKEVYELSSAIQKSVYDNFSIKLEREVNVW